MSAVRLAQRVEDVAQFRGRLAAQPAADELAIEVPDREAVVLRIQFGVMTDFVFERIEVGEQMTAHAIRVDHLQHGRFARDELVGRRRAHGQSIAISPPAHRLVRDAQVAIEVVVEAVFADEQLVDAGEERPRLRALDDAMVVRRRHRHHLRDAEVGEDGRIGRRVFGGVVDLAGGDDRSLRRHEPRDRSDRADRAGIRQRDRRAFEVRDFERVVARFADDVVVGLEELREVHRLRALDVRDEQRTRAVLALDVDGDAEVDVFAVDAGGLAVLRRERGVHPRELFQRSHDRVRDDVRERRFALTRQREVIVDDAPVFLERLDRDVADGRRRRDLERQRHVLRDFCRGAAKHAALPPAGGGTGVGRVVGGGGWAWAGCV